ncbi:hypothetical protein D3C87_1837140 [compost metagenome]
MLLEVELANSNLSFEIQTPLRELEPRSCLLLAGKTRVVATNPLKHELVLPFEMPLEKGKTERTSSLFVTHTLRKLGCLFFKRVILKVLKNCIVNLRSFFCLIIKF